MDDNENNDIVSDHEEENPEASHQETKRRQPRREFLKKAGAAGISASLTHFMLLGGSERNMAYATYNADCPSSSQDSCSAPSNPLSDACNFDYPDTCNTNGAPPGDQCNSNSVDTCPSSNPGNDQCGPAPDTDKCYYPYNAAAGEGGDYCDQGVGDVTQ